MDRFAALIAKCLEYAGVARGTPRNTLLADVGLGCASEEVDRVRFGFLRSMLEEEFSIDISDKEATAWRTFGDLVDCVTSLSTTKGG